MPNPKNYPHWPALVAGLAGPLVQVGVEGDEAFVPDMRRGLPLAELRRLVEACAFWIAVDSFLPHLAALARKPGVVLWSKSDPRHFGYAANLNLLRDRKYLRAQQFRVWEEEAFDAEAFVPADEALVRISAWRARPTGVVEAVA